MLTEAELTLLTAAADGELSSAEQRQYDDLVASNSQAAQFARQVQSTAARVRQFRRFSTPPHVLPGILARLPQSIPSTVRTAKRARQPIWLPYAVAASLLFTISAGSFWFFTARQDRESTARVLPSQPVATVATVPTPTPKPSHERDHNRDPQVKPRPDDVPPPRQVVAQLPIPPRTVAPLPRVSGGDFVGAGISETTKPLQAIELRLPLTGTMTEFARDEVKLRFTQDFASANAVRIDLFSRNLPGAIGALHHAAKASGVAVTTDSTTQERLNQQMPAAYGLFLEGLTPTEATAFLESVALQVSSAPQPVITSFHAFAAGTVEQKDWKELFGVDLGLFRSNRSKPQSPARPISDGTLGKIKGVLIKNPTKAGIVMTYMPAAARTVPQMSREVKAYLESRPDTKPGTLPIMIVLRPSAN